MQAVDGRCRTEELGTLSLKGIARTIRAFRLLELFDGPTRANPFVGRQAELQQLKAVLDAIAETAAGHAIYLRGEAGIGKTRIAEEIGRLASSQAFACHRALVLDFGAGKGQDAIRSLVRSLLCLGADLDETALKSAVESALSSGVISKDQIVFLNDLLDLPQPAEFRSVYSAMDNARRKQGTSETVAGIVRRISENQKLLLVVEDVHWADKLVLHHLAELTRAISDRPVVLAMTSRLEGDQIDDALRATTGSTPIITVDLRPLRHADAVVLASKFLDATESFAKSCVERAGGNPLFLEQLLRGAETAAEDAVPDQSRASYRPGWMRSRPPTNWRYRLPPRWGSGLRWKRFSMSLMIRLTTARASLTAIWSARMVRRCCSLMLWSGMASITPFYAALRASCMKGLRTGIGTAIRLFMHSISIERHIPSPPGRILKLPAVKPTPCASKPLLNYAAERWSGSKRCRCM